MFQKATLTSNGTTTFKLKPGKNYVLDVIGTWGDGALNVYYSGDGGDLLSLSNITDNMSSEILTASESLKFVLSGATGPKLLVRLAPVS